MRGFKVLPAVIGPCVVVCVLCAMFAVAPAFAASPWWQLNSSSRPANLAPKGPGTILVTATNLGDAPANGQASPVTITDKLPVGLTAKSVRGSAGLYAPNDVSGPGYRGLVECKLESTSSVSCLYNSGQIPSYERLQVEITVELAKEVVGDNEAQITGGEAASKRLKRPLNVSAEPTQFGIENYEFVPEEEGGQVDTQAGSHPFQVTSTFALNQTATEPYQPAQPKDQYFDLPVGFVGDPTVFPQCTVAQFDENAGEYINGCPADTAIGVAMITSKTVGRSAGGVFSLFTFEVPLFNLEPSVGEPARFGFDVVSNPVVLDTAVRTGENYGLVVKVHDTTQLPAFLEARVSIWGVPGDPRHDSSRGWSCGYSEAEALEFVCPGGTSVPKPLPLLTMPTSCAFPFETSATADSWAKPGEFTKPVVYSLQNETGEPLSLDGCNRLPFDPTISVAPDSTNASTPTGLSVGVHVPQDATLNAYGLAESSVKNTTVALPAGVQIAPGGADGLEACSEPEIGYLPGQSSPPRELSFTDGLPAPKETPQEPFCPNGAKIGTAEIQTPLLPNPLTGAVYLAQQNSNPFGSLVAMYVVAEDSVSGVLIKVAGQVHLDPVTGQIVTTFENTPELPFENLNLHFFGSARAPLSTPPLCGAYTTTSNIEGWAGNPASTPSSTFDINAGPNGAPCADPRPFTPGFQAGSLNLQAGSFTPFELTMTRPDADQTLSRVEMQMPPGLLGTLSNVKLCPEPQASQGTCGPESLIGETTVSAGLGNDPYTVTGGKVYITTGYKGAPYGLSIVNPAKAGPFDLGQVIVRATISVDPHTAALTIKSDPLPTIIDGIPLQIQHVNVSVNREKFTFNPTNCNKTQINGTLSSTEGVSTPVSTSFQVTNCATLAFKPKLTANTSGKTSRTSGASLHVKLTYPDGPYDANIARVKVDLPKQLPSRLTTLQKACPAAVFEANPASCPAASIVGHATATTPVLPVPLEGPAYFVSHAGEEFPSLIVVLQGYGTSVDLVGTTFINTKTNITSSTFKSVPDVPVGTFELTLPQGKYSALAATANLCSTKLAMPTAFVGQNGAELHQSTPISTTGCGKHAAKKKAKAKRKPRKK